MLWPPYFVFALPPLFLSAALLKNTPKRGHLIIHKADRFFGPSSTWTMLNSQDAGMTLAQDFQAPLIDSTIGQYNSAGMNNSSLWLAFLASLQQGRALERTFVLFTSTHCHAYRKYWKTGSF